MQLRYIFILVCVFAAVTYHLSKRDESIVVDDNDEEEEEEMDTTTDLIDGLHERKQEDLRNINRVSSEVLEQIIDAEKKASDEHTRDMYATLFDKKGATHVHRQQFGNDDKTRMWLATR
jgi:hypothetical protein